MGWFGDREFGLMGSIRRLVAGIVATVANRLELFVLELQEEGRRLLEVAVLLLFLGACVTLALLLLTFGIIVLLWDTARIEAIFGLMGVYLIVGWLIVLRLRTVLRRGKPFEETLKELRKDHQWLEGNDSTHPSPKTPSD